ncbi:hypothetical protein chiPu_0013313 [Chiloscyllium punctatum]|uniref:Uncharacterized protein n=1 Tax=Chiloscyllium punctatum TaxID=137246 RepID=A0A401SWV3_CHIPU|nr:hypothetical protein [Chiloscyllium punctatum]
MLGLRLYCTDRASKRFKQEDTEKETKSLCCETYRRLKLFFSGCEISLIAPMTRCIDLHFFKGTSPRVSRERSKSRGFIALCRADRGKARTPRNECSSSVQCAVQ